MKKRGMGDDVRELDGCSTEPHARACSCPQDPALTRPYPSWSNQDTEQVNKKSTASNGYGQKRAGEITVDHGSDGGRAFAPGKALAGRVG